MREPRRSRSCARARALRAPTTDAAIVSACTFATPQPSARFLFTLFAKEGTILSVMDAPSVRRRGYLATHGRNAVSIPTTSPLRVATAATRDAQLNAPVCNVVRRAVFIPRGTTDRRLGDDGKASAHVSETSSADGTCRSHDYAITRGGSYAPLLSHVEFPQRGFRGCFTVTAEKKIFPF